MDGFFQDAPTLPDPCAADPLLRAYMARVLPPAVRHAVEPDVRRFAGRVAGDVLAMARDAEAHEPRLIPYDPWGRRVDAIEVARGWEALGGVAAEEGLIALAYERAHGAHSRVHQGLKLYLFGPSSAIFNCPLAMTDGAAKVLDAHGGGHEAMRRAFACLTSRDPAVFWTSGQWMTERTGGSDVARTETTAVPMPDGRYALHGTKWFTSATTSPMALALARVVPSGGAATPGSKGLSVFLVETRDAAGRLNGIRVNRLKDKLGTRAMPTAELSLDGTPARLIGPEGHGVRIIATQFNVTRIHNALAAIGMMRRVLSLAKDYAGRREAFGRPLRAAPLHAETLADMETACRASFHVTFRVVELLGRVECEGNEADAALLRFLTPIAKLFTAKEAVAVVSEGLECFGGAGYIEDTGLPKWLRDAQVLPIWEGTTNVLSLDVLRALRKENAFGLFEAHVRACLAGVADPALRPSADRVIEAMDALARGLSSVTDQDGAEARARAWAMGLARVLAGALMIEHAAWASRNPDDPMAVAAACRWCRQDLLRWPRDGGFDPGESALLAAL